MSSNAITVTVIKEFTFDGDGVGHDASKEIAKLEKQGFRVLAPSSVAKLRPVREAVRETGPASLVNEILSRTGCDKASLASVLGVTRETIRGWRTVGRKPTAKALERIHEAHKLATESPLAFVRLARAARNSQPDKAPVTVSPAARQRPVTATPKLRDSDKLEIAVSYEDGATYAELAEKYGVSVRRITEVIREVAS